ncbi:accessory factor associated with RNA polymerase II [Tulasnella sp. 427]|nr:accessory factor associated with RNA polymerase II [Tulasnella sp. 427]
MNSTDPLVALQDAIKRNETISYLKDGAPAQSLKAATHVKLGSQAVLLKSTPTRWRRPANDKEAPAMDPSTDPAKFFALDAIALIWNTRSDPAAVYMRQATTEVVIYVQLTDRRPVLDWLEGKIQNHDRLAPLSQAPSTTPKTPPPNVAALPSSTLSPTKPSGATSSQQRAGGSKRSYVPDAADLEAVKRIRANEIELRDRNSILRGVKVNNFTQIKEYVAQLKSAAKGGKGSAPAAASNTASKPGSKKPRIFPIIMVSSSPTALLTLHNIKKFLEESQYEPSEIARQRSGGKTEDMIPIYRKKTHIDSSGKEMETRIKYFAVDGVDALAKFGPDAWDRVVCVMTTGQEWQFKPYKWTEPKQLFHNVKGIYFSWQSDPPNPRIKDWNVSELKIDQFKRHVDKSVVAHFWRLLDGWMQLHKPSLLS